MKLSYLVTCSTETKTLQNLLETLKGHLRSNAIYEMDEIVIVLDSEAKDNQPTKDILAKYNGKEFIKFEHPLAADYGSHKNFGNGKCKGDWIFQIDGDECPSFQLLMDVKDIIDLNPSIELFFVPRINDFVGVTAEHAKQWGWRLTKAESEPLNGRLIVNWPDYQGRIYKNEPSRIKWDRRLHEKIEGHTKYSTLPDDEEYALHHGKTIERQIATNLRYNKLFSQEENMGHDVFGKK